MKDKFVITIVLVLLVIGGLVIGVILTKNFRGNNRGESYGDEAKWYISNTRPRHEDQGVPWNMNVECELANDDIISQGYTTWSSKEECEDKKRTYFCTDFDRKTGRCNKCGHNPPGWKDSTPDWAQPARCYKMDSEGVCRTTSYNGDCKCYSAGGMIHVGSCEGPEPTACPFYGLTKECETKMSGDGMPYCDTNCQFRFFPMPEQD